MGTLRVKIEPTNPGDITVMVFSRMTTTPIHETFTVNFANPLDKTWTIDPGFYGVSISWDSGTHNLLSGGDNIIAINGVPKYFRVAGQSASATFDCRFAFPEQLKQDTVLSLQCLGDKYNPDHVWLNGRTGDGLVVLAENTLDHSGTKWKVHVVPSAGYVYRFECLGSIRNREHVWLNGSTADGSVNLAPQSSIQSAGVQWYVTQIQDGDGYRYNLKSMAISNPNYLYLDGKTGDGSVRLAPGTANPYTGTFWKFLM